MKRWIASACIALAACSNPQPQRAAQATAAPSAAPSGVPPLIVAARGTKERPIVNILYKGLRRVGVLLAARADYNTGGGKVSGDGTFYDADMTFYGQAGTNIEARAPRAVLSQAAQTITMLGGVNGHTSTGLTLSCQTLVYDKKTELLHGYSNVHVTSKSGLRSDGSRIDSDVTFEHMHLQ